MLNKCKTHLLMNNKHRNLGSILTRVKHLDSLIFTLIKSFHHCFPENLWQIQNNYDFMGPIRLENIALKKCTTTAMSTREDTLLTHIWNTQIKSFQDDIMIIIMLLAQSTWRQCWWNIRCRKNENKIVTKVTKVSMQGKSVTSTGFFS